MITKIMKTSNIFCCTFTLERYSLDFVFVDRNKKIAVLNFSERLCFQPLETVTETENYQVQYKNNYFMFILNL